LPIFTFAPSFVPGPEPRRRADLGALADLGPFDVAERLDARALGDFTPAPKNTFGSMTTSLAISVSWLKKTVFGIDQRHARLHRSATRGGAGSRLPLRSEFDFELTPSTSVSSPIDMCVKKPAARPRPTTSVR
jgi:hypothetical protein